MNTQSILAELEAQRDRIEAAIKALRGEKRRGSKPGRRLSAASKKLISDAMTKRWAERKRADKKFPRAA